MCTREVEALRAGDGDLRPTGSGSSMVRDRGARAGRTSEEITQK